jgi:hypothetical protein
MLLKKKTFIKKSTVETIQPIFTSSLDSQYELLATFELPRGLFNCTNPTNFMGQISSWDTDSRLAGQNIYYLL